MRTRGTLSGFELAFNSLIGTETCVIIDDSFRFQPRDKTAIRLLAWTLMLIPQAYNARVSFRSMNYQNPDRSAYTPDEEHTALFLDQIYKLPNANRLFEKVVHEDAPSWVRTGKMANN